MKFSKHLTEALLSGAFLTVAITSILGGVFFVSGKPMWLDELFTYFALKHDTFGALMDSYRAGINAAPPLFFVVAFGFTKIFGLSAFTLRIFSALCFALSILFLWSSLRRRLSALASAFSVIGVVCTSDLVLTQSREARFYGLYFLTATIFIHAVDRCYIKPELSHRSLLYCFFASALFCWSFYLGLIYLLVVLFFLLLGDGLAGRLRGRVYVAIAGGMLSLAICLPRLLTTTGTPGWIGRLGFGALFHAGESGVNFHFLMLLFAAVATPPILTLGKSSSAIHVYLPLRITAADFRLLWIAIAFAFVPLAVWIYSRFANPLLVDRYLMVSNIGYAILFGFLAEAILSVNTDSRSKKESIDQLSRRASYILSFGAVVTLAIYPVIAAKPVERHRKIDSFEFPLPLTEPLPIASAGCFSYFPRMFQDAQPLRYTLVTKTEAEANTWKKFNGSVKAMSVEAYLSANRKFYVVSEGLDMPWILDVVTAENGRYTPIPCEGGAKLWRVGFDSTPF